MGIIVNKHVKALRSLNLPESLSVIALAPHPDDFDAIGITMRYFKENGNSLNVMVATSGAGGVEDTFCSPPGRDNKTGIREREQRASCDYFGLPKDHLLFLRLEEDENFNLLENKENIKCVRRHILNKQPALVFMPHWHDTNTGHQRMYKVFRQAMRGVDSSLALFLNRDPKTISMRCDVYSDFDEPAAGWKGRLLRFHRSQHERNLNRRGHGLDERILRGDRDSAETCSLKMPYAEVFQLEFFGALNLEAVTEGL